MWLRGTGHIALVKRELGQDHDCGTYGPLRMRKEG